MANRGSCFRFCPGSISRKYPRRGRKLSLLGFVTFSNTSELHEKLLSSIVLSSLLLMWDIVVYVYLWRHTVCKYLPGGYAFQCHLMFFRKLFAMVSLLFYIPALVACVMKLDLLDDAHQMWKNSEVAQDLELKSEEMAKELRNHNFAKKTEELQKRSAIMDVFFSKCMSRVTSSDDPKEILVQLKKFNVIFLNLLYLNEAVARKVDDNTLKLQALGYIAKRIEDKGSQALKDADPCQALRQLLAIPPPPPPDSSAAPAATTPAASAAHAATGLPKECWECLREDLQNWPFPIEAFAKGAAASSPVVEREP